MPERDWIDTIADEYYPEHEIPVLEPRNYLDEAAVGFGVRYVDGASYPHLIYSEATLIAMYAMQYMMEDGASKESALDMACDWVHTNTHRSIPYMGNCAPVILIHEALDP